MAKLCYKDRSRLQQALAFPAKFPFLFNKVTLIFISAWYFPKNCEIERPCCEAVRKVQKLCDSQQNHDIESLQVCICAHKKAIGLSSIQAREEYTQMLMLVLSAPWSFKLKMGFSLTVLQDGERCDITGEYLESGYTNELKWIVKDYWTLLCTICLISGALWIRYLL